MTKITNMDTIEQLRLAIADEITRHADILGIEEVTLTQYNTRGFNSVGFEAIGIKRTTDGENVYRIIGLSIYGNRVSSTSEAKLLQSRPKILFK